MPEITTLAGSGRTGLRDGTAATAEFVEPVALAIAGDGSIVIADRGAQRIRRLDSHRVVTTIAGSGNLLLGGLGVAGGYRDGDAREAQFNQPTGVALAQDGRTIYIADLRNHCIRKLSGGVVSTFAGSPSRIGGADGDPNVASFNSPRSLIVDKRSDLIVADFPNGLRVVSASGSTKTMKTDEPIVSVTVAQFKPLYFGTGDEIILAASVRTLFAYDELSFKLLRRVPIDQVAEGGFATGTLVSAAQWDSHSIVYADPLYRTVRYLALPVDGLYTRVLTGDPLEDAAELSGTSRDGSGANASFDLPVAVVRRSDGTVVVADSGAKRLRTIGRFDGRNEESLKADDELPAESNKNEYRIALVGDSYVYTGLPWKSALPGVIETELNDRAAAPLAFRVYPIRRSAMGIDAALSLIDEELSSGIFDAIVLDYPNGGFVTEQSALATLPQVPSLGTKLRETASLLARSNVRFYIAYHPDAWQLPGELFFRLVPKGFSDDATSEVSFPDPGLTQQSYDAIINLLDRSGARVVDLWPTVLNYRRSENALPLYGAFDHHFTALGNELVATGIADAILADKPWVKIR